MQIAVEYFGLQFITCNFKYNYSIFLGVFFELLRLRIDSGDKVLQNHLENGRKNATYTSPRIQNEIINLCGETIRDMIIADVKQASAYSILADETADISGIEQLSIGVRFFDKKKGLIREEFLGYMKLNAMDAKTISTAIDQMIQNCGLDCDKCVGQGYDGCSAMAGKDAGVQAILREKYTKALYFHCASHILNLVVNDLNSVPEVRNTVSTIKDIINFFRESVLRRRYAPNIPALCETRWTQKYRSISIFKANFVALVAALETLSIEGNAITRKSAFQLHAAATKPTFIICTVIIAKYSGILEPVANALQSKSLDLFKCRDHIERILSVISGHREEADNTINDILEEATTIAHAIDVELDLPRLTQRQQHRSNHPSSNPTDYWKRSLLIPYLDSLKSSLEHRFARNNSFAFSLFMLHPSNMMETSINDLKKKIQPFSDLYDLDLSGEIELWYEIWKSKQLNRDQLKDIELCEVMIEANSFFSTIQYALEILLALPCTTCTIERSFSTLRRVKTWLRSTMGENRLNGKY